MALKITNKKKMPKPDRIIPVAVACMPKAARILHKTAMGVYWKALECLADGHAHIARAAFVVAYQCEKMAVRMVHEDIQPLAGTLWGSTAVLAYHAGFQKEALRLAHMSLGCCIPQSLATVLYQLQRGEGRLELPYELATRTTLT